VEEVARMQGAQVMDSFTVALPPGVTDMLVGAVAEKAVARAVRALTENGEAESEHDSSGLRLLA
jgi:hypothetical protein